jgi:hypothetical protein
MSEPLSTHNLHCPQVVCDAGVTAGTYELLISPVLWVVEGYDEERPVAYWWGALWGPTPVHVPPYSTEKKMTP